MTLWHSSQKSQWLFVSFGVKNEVLKCPKDPRRSDVYELSVPISCDSAPDSPGALHFLDRLGMVLSEPLHQAVAFVLDSQPNICLLCLPLCVCLNINLLGLHGYPM